MVFFFFFPQKDERNKMKKTKQWQKTPSHICVAMQDIVSTRVPTKMEKENWLVDDCGIST